MAQLDVIDEDSDAEIDQLDESEYGPGSAYAAPQRPTTSSTPSLTQLRPRITRITRASRSRAKKTSGEEGVSRNRGNDAASLQHDSPEPVDQAHVQQDTRDVKHTTVSAALDEVCSVAIDMFQATAIEHGVAIGEVFAHFHNAEQQYHSIDALKVTPEAPAVPPPSLTSGGLRHSSYVKTITCEDSKDREARVKYLKKQLTAQIRMLGVKWRSDLLFPWKNMIVELANAGVLLVNWPEHCRHPGQTPKDNHRGISELHSSEQNALMGALVHPEHPLYFLMIDDAEKRKAMLSDKYPVIIGIPPNRLSKEARGLFVFFSGRDSHQGRQRLGVMTEGSETAKSNRQRSPGKSIKSRPATRSKDSTAAATAAHPIPNYDDFETLLPDGSLAVPPCKIEPCDDDTVLTPQYIQVSDNEDDALVLESSPTFLGKTRVKTRGQAAKKPTVWLTDDGIEDELPNGGGRNQVDDDEALWVVDAGRRKQRDDADGVASEHQSKRARLTTRVTNIDTPVRQTFDRASVHGEAEDRKTDRAVIPTSESTFDERAPIVGSETADGPISTYDEASAGNDDLTAASEDEKASTSVGKRVPAGAPVAEGAEAEVAKDVMTNDHMDYGKTESRHPESNTQPAGSRAIPASYHTLGLHPEHFEFASGLSRTASSLPFGSNLPASHPSSSSAMIPENGVVYPVHPFNPHAGQPMPSHPVTGPYVVYPIHPFNPHVNQPKSLPLVTGSYPPTTVYPATGPSPDALLSMLRMDPRYAGLFNYAPFCSMPAQQQHGVAFPTGPPYSASGAPP